MAYWLTYPLGLTTLYGIYIQNRLPTHSGLYPSQQTVQEDDKTNEHGGKGVVEAIPSKSTVGGRGSGGAGSVRWYERAYDYWEDGDNCALDDDGVLGGYGHISPVDIGGSSAFLDELKSMRPLLGDEKAAGGQKTITWCARRLILQPSS